MPMRAARRGSIPARRARMVETTPLMSVIARTSSRRRGANQFLVGKWGAAAAFQRCGCARGAEDAPLAVLVVELGAEDGLLPFQPDVHLGGAQHAGGRCEEVDPQRQPLAAWEGGRERAGWVHAHA